MEWNHLCNFGGGHYEEHPCEIILNLDQWFRRCSLKKKIMDEDGGVEGACKACMLLCISFPLI